MVFDKKKKAKMRVALCICLLNIFLSSISVDASEEDEHERGNLRINSHVISDTREEITHHTSIGFEVVPFLFLENMAEMEASRVQVHHTHLENARTIVFMTDVLADRLNTSEIVAMLFQETEEVSGVRQLETTYTLYFEISIWLWVIIGIISTTVLGYVGFLVGKKASNLIHKERNFKKRR